MDNSNIFPWLSLLLVSYVDIGTGQVITSSLAPILAAASSVLVGIFGFLLLRAKQITAFIRKKVCSKKSSS